MEHLFFHSTDKRMRIESNSAVLSDIYERDWTTLATHTDMMPHVTPTTPVLASRTKKVETKNGSPFSAT